MNPIPFLIVLISLFSAGCSKTIEVTPNNHYRFSLGAKTEPGEFRITLSGRQHRQGDLQ